MNPDRRGSFISSQLIVINDKLQLLYDEIGISEDERDARERDLYSAVSAALEQQVREVSAEKQAIFDKCVGLKASLDAMNAALDDVPDVEVAGAVEIRPPLLPMLETLTAKHAGLEQVFSQRYEHAKDLFGRLAFYAEAMRGALIEPAFAGADVDTYSLAQTSIVALEAQVARLEAEHARRVAAVQADATQIVKLWAQLGTSQHAIDRDLLACYKDRPEQLGLTNDALARLTAKKNALQAETDDRIRRLGAVKDEVQHLWQKLSEDDSTVRAFDRAHRGIALPVIAAYEHELARLNEKKRDYMHIFVEDARQSLQKLWDSLYFSEEEMLEFTPAWTDIFTDASLAAHESEIARLERLLAERKPVLALIEQWRGLQRDSAELEQSQQDSSRLMSRGAGRRDPSRLLREEQMRKRIAKQKPKVMADLRSALVAWESETSHPFMVNGERFLDTLRDEDARARARKTPARPTAASISSASASSSASTRPTACARPTVSRPRPRTSPAAPPPPAPPRRATTAGAASTRPSSGCRCTSTCTPPKPKWSSPVLSTTTIRPLFLTPTSSSSGPTPVKSTRTTPTTRSSATTISATSLSTTTTTANTLPRSTTKDCSTTTPSSSAGGSRRRRT
ncbi:microtubule associated protein-domain-containing protein [Dipodascopsis tothii]|uniref:microtubule associated protein-domain-containing protein n=1 Tax=Dipodascopsis tothii TaxID=44089 RepID=UPI0034CDEAB4